MNNDKTPQVEGNATLAASYYFSAAVYSIERPDFLEIVSKVSEDALVRANKENSLDDIYPVRMSDQYMDDPRIKEFTDFVGNTAWGILNDQGYDMENLTVAFSDMWTQEHHKHSAMEQHVHGRGAQIVGFYFLETPENCSKVLFHDPRAAKVQTDLPEKNVTEATLASQVINYTPKPGLLVFSNAWLPHSFTRHAAEEPIKFVHFNLYAAYNPQPTTCGTPAEVI